MSFKTNLFKLFNVRQSYVVIDDYEIETIQHYGVDANGEPVLRCECDENDWYFADQEVEVNEDGECSAMTASGDWDVGGKPFVAKLEFQVKHPIAESDL